MEGLVSNEIAMPHCWGSETRNFVSNELKRVKFSPYKKKKRRRLCFGRESFVISSDKGPTLDKSPS